MAAGIPTSFQIGQKTTAAAAAAKYTARASGAGTYWATGYLTSKVNPFQAAAAAANYWLQRVNEAGTAMYTAGLNAVDQVAVARLVSTQGPTLYNQGITNKGSPNYAKSSTGLIPALQNAAAALPPRGTLQQNIARATAMMNAAAAMRGLYRARA
ncbi:MAG TPA: hypothetical protein VGI65_00740 [Steroidobacteraceae bacterium]|jgi:hypothetical protein